jgi:hypothetical protein
MGPTALGAAALVIASLASARASAQNPEPEKDAPLAEALFRDGRALMESGRFAEACPKLAESQRVDPHLGTLLNLAACHELQGRTATAWAEYTEARSQAAHAGRADRESFAREHARVLEPKLSRVVVRAERAIEGLEVDLDGEALGAGALGTALPVDPGHHELRATAPGHAPWSAAFEAASGPVTQTIRVPPLVPAAPATVGPLGPPAPPAPARVGDASQEAAARRSHAPTALFWGAAAVGVVGAGVGSTFGILAFDQNSRASKSCPNETCTTEAGREADSNARTDATVSTVAFGVALAAAAGAALIIAIGHEDAPRVHVAVTPGGVSLAGVW